MADCTYNGRAFRTLNIIDEYTLECLAICVGCGLQSEDEQARPKGLLGTRGVLVYLRSNNGLEFANQKIRT